MRFDSTQPQEQEAREFTPMETDFYPMKIIEAKIAPNKFPDRKTGEFKDILTVVWALDPDTDEQRADYEAAGYEPGQKVWQRFYNTWYGDSFSGIPSVFKQFMEPLIKEGLVPPVYDIASGDEPATSGHLVGIRRRVNVQKYIKEEGVNKGQWGNRVTDVSPLKPAKQNGAAPTQPPSHLSDADIRAQLLKPADYEAMDDANLCGYARWLGNTCGGSYATTRWETLGRELVLDRLGRMTTFAARKFADPDGELEF